MQMRFKEKKKIGDVTGLNYSFLSIYSYVTLFYLGKKSTETEDKKLNGTIDEHDESSNHGRMSVDGNDNSGLIKEEITPKRNAKRTAKEKVSKYGGDNEDEEEDSIIHGMESDDNHSDYMGSDSETEKKIKKTNTKPRKPKSSKLNHYLSKDCICFS